LYSLHQCIPENFDLLITCCYLSLYIVNADTKSEETISKKKPAKGKTKDRTASPQKIKSNKQTENYNKEANEKLDVSQKPVELVKGTENKKTPKKDKTNVKKRKINPPGKYPTDERISSSDLDTLNNNLISSSSQDETEHKKKKKKKP